MASVKELWERFRASMRKPGSVTAAILGAVAGVLAVGAMIGGGIFAGGAGLAVDVVGSSATVGIGVTTLAVVASVFGFIGGGILGALIGLAAVKVINAIRVAAKDEETAEAEQKGSEMNTTPVSHIKHAQGPVTPKYDDHHTERRRSESQLGRKSVDLSADVDNEASQVSRDNNTTKPQS